MANQPSPRRRFQFRLRTLMIGVTLLAVVYGYVGWQAKIVRERRALQIKYARQIGCNIRFAGFPGEFIPADFQTSTTWVRRLLGDVDVYRIGTPPNRDFTPSELEEIHRILPEATTVDRRKLNQFIYGKPP
jgi:hypothetical protein